jgi:EmrB/QacA subfamily drug resistance transporter
LIFTLGLGVFAGALDAGVLSPALPALTRAFAIAPRDSAWVFTLYLIANVVAIPIAAKLSDVYGRRPVYIACLAVFACGSAFAVAAPTFGAFLAARAIQAIGAGGIFPVATAAIADRVPLERRGAALGMLGAVWGLAAIIGPNLGGVVTHFWSWRWIFAFNVPLAAIVAVLALRTVPAAAAKRRGPLDVMGIAALSVGLLGLMIGLTHFDAWGSSLGDNQIVVAFVAALIAFLALVTIERNAKDPVIAPDLFATRQLRLTYALEIAIGMLEAALFFIPSALVAAQHLNAALAGLIAAVGALVFVATIPLAGRALDAFGSRAVLTSGATLTALGLGAFALSMNSLPLSVATIALAGVGFGALLGAPTRYIVSSEVGQDRRATGIGLLSIFLIIGMIAGGSLAGGLIGADIGDTGAFRTTYLTFAALALAATLATRWLRPRTCA